MVVVHEPRDDREGKKKKERKSELACSCHYTTFLSFFSATSFFRSFFPPRLPVTRFLFKRFRLHQHPGTCSSTNRATRLLKEEERARRRRQRVLLNSKDINSCCYTMFTYLTDHTPHPRRPRTQGTRKVMGSLRKQQDKTNLPKNQKRTTEEQVWNVPKTHSLEA